jgi:hypothetical protein
MGIKRAAGRKADNDFDGFVWEGGLSLMREGL